MKRKGTMRQGRDRKTDRSLTDSSTDHASEWTEAFLCLQVPNIYKGPCIYLLVRSGTVVYVGRTERLWLRMAQHADKDKIAFNEVRYIKVERVEMAKREAEFIARYRPTNNYRAGRRITISRAFANANIDNFFSANKRLPSSRTLARRIGCGKTTASELLQEYKAEQGAQRTTNAEAQQS